MRPLGNMFEVTTVRQDKRLLLYECLYGALYAALGR